MSVVSTDRRFGVSASVAVKAPVRVASTAPNMTLSGLQTVDGVDLIAGDRVLVWHEGDLDGNGNPQGNSANNGIYVADTGAWSRAPDFDGTFDAVCGTLVFVRNGTVGQGFYYCTSADPVVIGSSSITFGQASTALAILTPFGQSLLIDASASAARATLGLGTIATQNANSVAITGGTADSVTITGGSITGMTDIAVADGGTGRSSHTAYSVICGGTTTTAAQQSVASVGTANQLLSSNGAGALPSFRTLAGTDGASLVLLATATASSSSSISFTTSDFSFTAYDTYIFEFVNLVPQTNAVNLQGQISQNGGGIWKAGTSYNGLIIGFSTAGTATSGGADGQSAITLTSASALSNAANQYVSGMLIAKNPSDTTATKKFRGEFEYYDGTHDRLEFPGVIYAADSGAYNAIKFFFSSGNIVSGTVRVYGIRTS